MCGAIVEFSFIYINTYIRWIYGVGAINAATHIIHGGIVPREAAQVTTHVRPGKPPANINGPQQTAQQVLPATGPLEV